MIHHGDCLDVMAGMDPDSVDAIVTDPPYGLEFMGKAWDKLKLWGDVGKGKSAHALATGRPSGRRGFDGYGVTPSYQAGAPAQQFHFAWAEAAYRVAKPSAYLLAFGGTRTAHRMTCALEDAGWIIRDMLVWGYASGFPKSKASLKPAWEPIVMARKPGPLRMLAIDECRIGYASDADRAATESEMSGPRSRNRVTTPDKLFPVEANGDVSTHPLGRWPANIVLTDPIFDGGIEGVVGGGETTPVQMNRTNPNAATVSGAGIFGVAGRQKGGPEYSGDTGTYSRFFTIPEGGTLCEWCGASPAEASSRQRSGPGASVPGPVPTEASPVTATTTASPTTSGTAQTSWLDGSATTSRSTPSPGSRLVVPSPSGRVRSAVPPRTSSGITMITDSRWMCDSCADDATRFSMVEQESGERNYPWAYLIPKAARSDREPVLGGTLPIKDANKWNAGGIGERRRQAGMSMRENVHPTVKPVDLMRHLVRLVTPTGGTVLDPFLGSGTTALAAEMEGFGWIGIEREAEYVAIAEARLNGTQRGLGLG